MSLTDDMKAAEAAVEQIIDRGRRLDSTEHERWVAWNLLNNNRFRQSLTEKLARRVA